MASSARGRTRRTGGVSSSSDALPVAVELNVYDLNVQIPDWSVNAMYVMGVGLYHSGVSIFGTEYCFGGHPDDTTGVFEVTPRSAPEAKFRECIIVGYTSLSPIDVALLVNQMASSAMWRGTSYNLLTRNCNHFASDLCEKLCGNAAPGWINRLAWMGEKAKFLLPEGVDKPMMAPVRAEHVRDAHAQQPQPPRRRSSDEADPDAFE